MKRCTRCGIEKPETPEFFPNDKTRARGLHPWCRKCVSEQGRIRRAPFLKDHADVDDLAHNISITEGGCWEWRFTRNEFGYGLIPYQGRNVRAHRFYFEKMVGPIPKGGEVHHVCENPPCVNPSHLMVVTAMEHRALSRSAKLDWTKVDEIRRRHAEGESASHLAREYGVHNSVVCRIVNGKAWVLA